MNLMNPRLKTSMSRMSHMFLLTQCQNLMICMNSYRCPNIFHFHILLTDTHMMKDSFLTHDTHMRYNPSIYLRRTRYSETDMKIHYYFHYYKMYQPYLAYNTRQSMKFPRDKQVYMYRFLYPMLCRHYNHWQVVGTTVARKKHLSFLLRKYNYPVHNILLVG